MADTSKAFQYAKSPWSVDKQLEPDGSIQTAAGTTVSPADTGRAFQYAKSPLSVDKWLEPDGSVIARGSGSGGSTTPGGTQGQVQYNNAGAFAGAASIITDNTFTAIGGMSAVGTNPLSVGVGANSYFQVIPPGGTYNANGAVVIRPSGTSGAAYVFCSGGPLIISSGAGSYVRMGYPSGAVSLDVIINGSYVNAVTVTGSAAGSPPTISATGSDTNINMKLTPKGTGTVVFNFANVPVYANNAAAVSGGLAQGSVYRTGADPDVLCIVH